MGIASRKEKDEDDEEEDGNKLNVRKLRRKNLYLGIYIRYPVNSVPHQSTHDNVVHILNGTLTSDAKEECNE